MEKASGLTNLNSVTGIFPVDYVEHIKKTVSSVYSATKTAEHNHPNAEGAFLKTIQLVISRL